MWFRAKAEAFVVNRKNLRRGSERANEGGCRSLASRGECLEWVEGGSTRVRACVRARVCVRACVRAG